jgi:Domain of unknown function (DUF4270)
MQINKLKKLFLSLFIVIFLSSCDRELNDIGSDVIGDDHFGMERVELDIKAFNQPIGPMNTTNLTNNPLGVYKNSFGKTIAHFVTQVELSSTTSNIVNPATAVIENVYLEVPYSSRQTVASTTDPRYELLNIYPKDVEAPTNNKFKLSVFENGYDLRVTSLEGQEIFMDEKTKFLPLLRGTDAAGNSIQGGNKLNDDADVKENIEFTFSNKFAEDEDYTSIANPAPDKTKVAPKMKIRLNKNFFKKKIFENTSVLANQDLFKNHFRGLYFQVEEIAGNNSMSILNFADSKIIIQYKDEVTTGNFTKKQYVINVRGISASLQDFTPNLDDPNPNSYLNALNSDPLIEPQFLFQKSGARGCMTVLGINKSSQNFQDFLVKYKDKVIINDAFIEYYVDKSFHGTDENNNLNNPFRSIAYNIPYETTLLDFQLDNTTVSSNRFLDKSIFGGILKDYSYKVRVTQHLINLIKGTDAKNVSIGIVGTNDINSFGASSTIFKSRLKSEIGTLPTRQTQFQGLLMEESPEGLHKIKTIPAATSVLPVGAKIYGTASTDAKKMKLVVYYTLKD